MEARHRNIIIGTIGGLLVALGLLIYFLGAKRPSGGLWPSGAAPEPPSSAERLELLDELIKSSAPTTNSDRRQAELENITDSSAPQSSHNTRRAVLKKIINQ